MPYNLPINKPSLWKSRGGKVLLSIRCAEVSFAADAEMTVDFTYSLSLDFDLNVFDEHFRQACGKSQDSSDEEPLSLEAQPKIDVRQNKKEMSLSAIANFRCTISKFLKQFNSYNNFMVFTNLAIVITGFIVISHNMLSQIINIFVIKSM